MKVRVKTWKEMLEDPNVELDGNGNLINTVFNATEFASGMEYLCDEIIEVKKIGGCVDYDYWYLEPWMYEEVYPIPKETKPQRSSRVVKLDQMEEMGLERIGVSTFIVPKDFFVTTNNSLPIPEIVIDFTAIDENKFVEYMCKRIFSEGIKLGRKEVSTQLNTILSYANEED